MNTEKWIIGFILSMCFIFGESVLLLQWESMQFGYRILDRNTSEGIEVDGTQ